MIIGVNCRTAPAEVGERFRIGEERQVAAVQELRRAEGVEEIMVLATHCRTEFVVWTHDVCNASNSVLSFLTREYGLRLSDWQHFYRRLDQTALEHMFRVASSAEHPDMAGRAWAALQLAQRAGAAGPVLSQIVETVLAVTSAMRATHLSGGQAETAVARAAKILYAALRDEHVAVRA